MHEFLLIAQLLADNDASFTGWVDSRNPEELCRIYVTGMIDDTLLPGGRAQDPCEGVVNPLKYMAE